MTDNQAKRIGLKAAWQRVRRECVVLPITVPGAPGSTSLCLVPLSDLTDELLLSVMDNHIPGINIPVEERIAAKCEREKRRTRQLAAMLNVLP
jgi:hypothetical protein